MNTNIYYQKALLQKETNRNAEGKYLKIKVKYSMWFVGFVGDRRGSLMLDDWFSMYVSGLGRSWASAWWGGMGVTQRGGCFWVMWLALCERETQKREKGRGTVRSRTKGESERRRERENEWQSKSVRSSVLHPGDLLAYIFFSRTRCVWLTASGTVSRVAGHCGCVSPAELAYKAALAACVHQCLHQHFTDSSLQVTSQLPSTASILTGTCTILLLL